MKTHFYSQGSSLDHNLLGMRMNIVQQKTFNDKYECILNSRNFFLRHSKDVIYFKTRVDILLIK